MSETTPDIIALIARILPNAVQTRRHLHQNPELSGEEVQTSLLVAEQLRSLGLDEVQTGVAKHGVVGLLRGRKRAAPRSPCAPTWTRCPFKRPRACRTNRVSRA